MICTSCGSEVKEGKKFCEMCGQPVNNAGAQVGAAIGAPVVAQNQPASYPAQAQLPDAQQGYGQQSGAQYGYAQQQGAQYGYAQQPGAQYGYGYGDPEAIYLRDNSGGLLQAAFIVNVVFTVLMGVFIIPLAWCIPMTIHSYGIYKGRKPNTVAFGVCTLLFVSLISGILLLVADKDM